MAPDETIHKSPTTRPLHPCDVLDFVHIIADIVGEMEGGSETEPAVMRGMIKYAYWCDRIQRNKRPNPFAALLEKILEDESMRKCLLDVVRASLQIVEPPGDMLPRDRMIEDFSVDTATKWRSIAGNLHRLLDTFLEHEERPLTS